jgi:hypothetical protein
MTSKQPADAVMHGERGAFDAQDPPIEPKGLKSSYENLQLEGKILN